jgi:hypothetical protein
VGLTRTIRAEDWRRTELGSSATYQHTFGTNTLAIETNFLFEQQNLGAFVAAGRSANSTNYLDQFRITSTYAWDNAYEFTLAYTDTWGSTDPLLYPAVANTGSAAGNPGSQAIIVGNDTTHPGYPWLNLRVGVQYTYYLMFNGGTTNYDGHGRNATDNNALLLFTWLSF